MLFRSMPLLTTRCGGHSTERRIIARLPLTWDSGAHSPGEMEHDILPAQQDTYRDAAARLHELAARRANLQRRLDAIQTLKSLLEPLHDPPHTIQPNLVTHDGPLAPELSKTKALAARVAGRVGERYGDVQGATSAHESGSDASEERGNVRLARILDSW